LSSTEATPRHDAYFSDTAGSSKGSGVWCRDCLHQVEPEAPELVRRYGADITVLDWRDRLVCSQCGIRQVDMVVSGTERR
jgi:hypothetical protein